MQWLTLLSVLASAGELPEVPKMPTVEEPTDPAAPEVPPLVAMVGEHVARLDELTPETCVASLEGWYTTLEQLDPAGVDIGAIMPLAPDLIDAVWALRLRLHGHIQTMVEADRFDDDCLRSMRRADIANRYLLDHLFALLPPEQQRGGLLTTPGFASLEESLRTGDVLVTRGTALSSAGIAHMGRIDGQFSHNVMIYRPDPTGPVLTAESYMEWGAITQDLHALLEHGVGRVVVLRYQDEAVAKQAGEAAWTRIETGPKIFYDDGFDYDDHTRLFCSEVPRWAFTEAGGPTDIPRRLSVFEIDKNAGMYRAMGIAADVTSAPSDILYDPRFEVVAEWRDVPKQRELRQHDATVEALFSWMEQLDYTLEPGPAERNLIGFGLFVRRIPLLGLALKNSLHPKSSRQFLVTSLALSNAADRVYAEFATRLEGRDDIVSWTEMRAMLEQIRVDDLETWREDPKHALFHRVLHPR